MSFLPAFRAGNPGRFVNNWTPADLLPSAPLAIWDADRSDLITHVAGAVESWKDTVGAYDLTQSVGASKPIYGAASFGSRGGVTFDAVDDELSGTVPGTFPINGDGSEIHILVDQTVPGSTSGVLRIFGYGGVSTATSRMVTRTTGSGLERPAATTDQTTTGPGIFFGKHAVRAQFRPTERACDMDTARGTPVAMTLSTTSVVRMRMGATTQNTPASFFGGTMHLCVITGTLDDLQADLLQRWMMRRI